MKNRFLLALAALTIFAVGCKEDKIGNPEEVLATTDDINSLTLTSAVVEASAYGEGITDRGICWNATGEPTLEDTSISDGSGAGKSQFTLEQLEPATTYYVRAYATSGSKTVYGTVRPFTTMSPLKAEILKTEPNVYSISVTANLDGWSEIVISESGVCYGTSPDPTVSGTHIKSTDNVMGDFDVTITELESFTQYYIRAYAVSDGKTVYSPSVEVKTLSPISTEILSTVPGIYSISVKSKLTLLDNDATISESGVCYGTSPDPTVSGDHIKSSATEIGEYDIIIPALESETNYYIRAYAICDGQTFYSNAVEVKTFKDLWAILLENKLNYGIVRKEGTVNEIVPNSNPAETEEVTGPLFLMHYSINTEEEEITITYIETDGNFDAKHVTKKVQYDVDKVKLSWETVTCGGNEFSGIIWDAEKGFSVDGSDGLTLDTGLTTSDAKALFSGRGDGGFDRVSEMRKTRVKYHPSLEPVYNSVELPNDNPIEFNAGSRAIVGMPANGHNYVFRKVRFVDSKIAGDKLAFEFDSYDTSQGWMVSDSETQNRVAKAMAPILKVWEAPDGVIVIKERKSNKTFQDGGFQLYMISATGPEWFQLYLRNAADK